MRPLASPAVSVVIPTYNRAELVSRAIGVVLGQTFSDLEVVVVDDGSTDGTDQMVRSLGDERIRYVWQSNQGESAARNAGLFNARGQVVTFLDSDDEARPDWLDLLTMPLRAGEAEIALCGIENLFDDGSSNSWVPDPGGPDLEAVVTHFEAGQVAFDREVLSNAGGFSTSIRYGQHTELAIRLLCLTSPQPRLSVVPRPLVVVNRRPSNRGYGSAPAESARYVLLEHHACRERLPHLWAAYHSIAGVDLARDGRLREARRHFAEASRLEPRTWRHRARRLTATTPALARRAWPVRDQEPVVLFVATAQGLGGSMRSLASVLQHLDGASPAVACAPGTTFTDLLAERHLTDTVVELPGQHANRLLARLAALLKITGWAWRRRRELVALHANGLAERSLVTLAAAVTGVPVVVWMHEWAVSPWARRLNPLISRFTPETRFAAVSEHAAKVLVDAGLAAPDAIAIVPNPVDPADVVAGHRSTHLRPVVAYLGAPARYKGFHFLPDIIRALDGVDLDWEIFAGPRTALPEVWADLETIRRPDVRIPGKLLDVRDAYARCDIVVCPSLEESFGRVVAEAMCNGLPVVASDLPAVRDLVGDDEAGLLVPAGDWAAAATALRRLAADPDLRERLGACGRRRAEAFEPGPIVSLLQALYGLTRTSLSGEMGSP